MKQRDAASESSHSGPEARSTAYLLPAQNAGHSPSRTQGPRTQGPPAPLPPRPIRVTLPPMNTTHAVLIVALTAGLAAAQPATTPKKDQPTPPATAQPKLERKDTSTHARQPGERGMVEETPRVLQRPRQAGGRGGGHRPHLPRRFDHPGVGRPPGAPSGASTTTPAIPSTSASPATAPSTSCGAWTTAMLTGSPSPPRGMRPSSSS